MKIGLFGGSFDPIHCGHIAPVQAVRHELGLDQVIYLPTAVSPLKRQGGAAPPLARYAMVELALLHEPGLLVSPHELTPEQPAYTADTIDHFRRLLPEAELHLILGADSFLDLPRWVRSHDIVAGARVIVLRRPGCGLDAAALPPAVAALVAGGRVEIRRQATPDLSSTRVREMLSRGERPPAGWLPESVVEFIEKYRLYR